MSGTLLAVHFPEYFVVVEVVEVKAHPLQYFPLEFKDLDGKTVGLLLCMAKIYFATIRYVIIDYGFCFFKVLIQLRKKGVFPCAFINKRRYRPSVVPGKYMEDHFRYVEAGETDSIQVTVNGVIYNLSGMKEPKYMMRMMASDCFFLEGYT